MLGDFSTIDSAVADAQASYDMPNALQYILDNFPNFQNIGQTIVGWQRAASANAVRAAQLGRPDIQAAMQAQITTLGDLDVKAGNVLDEITALDQGLHNMGLDQAGNPLSASAIPDSAFGQEPLTIAAALALAVVIVGYMSYVMFHTTESANAITAQGKVLDLLQAGKVTPAQANTLMKTTADTSAQTTQTGLAGVMNALKGIAVPAAIVAVAIFVVPEVSKHISTGRRR
jgi:hypothetical protein